MFLIWILPGWIVGQCLHHLRQGWPQMALTGVNKRVRKVFEITKMEQIFLMFPTLSDALEAFTNAGTA